MYRSRGGQPRTIPAGGLRVAAAASGTALELRSIASGEPATPAVVEIDGDGAVQLVVDGAECAAARVVLRPHPLRLRILDTGRGA